MASSNHKPCIEALPDKMTTKEKLGQMTWC